MATGKTTFDTQASPARPSGTPMAEVERGHTPSCTPSSAQRSEVMLDLGCGRYKVPGTIGVDQSLEVKPDLVCDFVKSSLPFRNESIDRIYCRHVLEHIQDIWALMHEIHRVLKPDARLIIEVPYWACEGAFRDPTHVRFFSEKSFDYWDPECECKYYTTDGGYKVLDVEHMLHPSPLIRLVAKCLGVRFLKLFNNTIIGLRFTLAPVA